MADWNIMLTPMDHEILDSYKKTMDGLADYLGDGYEFVLHSLEDLEHSVVKIINGHHTGRKIGTPITDLALAMLARLQEEQDRDYITYTTKNKKGEPLKASTIIVRGEKNRIIALLCINFYLNTPLSNILGALSLPNKERVTPLNENFAENALELLEKSLKNAIAQVEADGTTTCSNRNKRIVELLHGWGSFNIKNAVDLTSQELGISKNTVYLHLRNLAQSNGTLPDDSTI